MGTPGKTSPLVFLLSAGALFVKNFLSIYGYFLIGDEGYTYLVSVNATHFHSGHNFSIVMDND
jgi:hypothetical protein